MTQPPAHSPARWEDLANCLAWPLLLKLPALALRPSRLLIAYLAAIPLTLLWQTQSSLLTYLTYLFEAPQTIIASIALPWFFKNRMVDAPDPNFWFGLFKFANIPTESVTPIHCLIVVTIILIIALTTTMLARSTALEVARGLQVSPRYMLSWAIRRWRTPFLCFWPILLALIVATPSALLALAAKAFEPEGPAAIGLLAIAGILAFLAAIVVYFALAAAPLTPAAIACDDGDDFDAIQRTIAIIIAQPIRAILCFAWVLLIMRILAAVTRWLVDSTAELLPLAGDRLILTVHAGATLPLQFLPTAIALSTLATGLTLTYLYLRRIADEQDLSEVPVQG